MDNPELTGHVMYHLVVFGIVMLQRLCIETGLDPFDEIQNYVISVLNPGPDDQDSTVV